MSKLYVPIANDRELDIGGNISYFHLMKHLGQAFSVYLVDPDFDLTDEVYVYFLAPVSGLPQAHFVPFINNSSAVKLDIIRSPSSVTTTSPQTVNNDNENSSNTSKAQVWTASAFVGGTVIRTLTSGSTNKIGGDISRQDEIILRAGTEYIFKLYDSGAENSILNIGVSWYEDILKTFART